MSYITQFATPDDYILYSKNFLKTQLAEHAKLMGVKFKASATKADIQNAVIASIAARQPVPMEAVKPAVISVPIPVKNEVVIMPPVVQQAVVTNMPVVISNSFADAANKAAEMAFSNTDADGNIDEDDLEDENDDLYEDGEDEAEDADEEEGEDGDESDEGEGGIDDQDADAGADFEAEDFGKQNPEILKELSERARKKEDADEGKFFEAALNLKSGKDSKTNFVLTQLSDKEIRSKFAAEIKGRVNIDTSKGGNIVVPVIVPIDPQIVKNISQERVMLFDLPRNE